MRVVEIAFLALVLLGLLILGQANLPFSAFANFSLSIFLGAVPFLLLASLASGTLEAFLPVSFFKRLGPQESLSGWKGMLYGLVLPITPPAVLPFGKQLSRDKSRGIGGLLYFLAGDSISPVVLFSTFVAFGLSWKVALSRYFLSMLVLVLVGLLLRLFLRKPTDIFSEPIETPGEQEDLEEEKGVSLGEETRMAKSPWIKLRLALHAAANHFILTGRFLVLGACAISFLVVLVPLPLETQFSGRTPLSILAVMALALLLSVPSSTDSFLMAAFRGLPLWLKFSFLLAGPLLNLKLLHSYSAFLTKRATVALLLSTILVVFFVTYALSQASCPFLKGY